MDDMVAQGIGGIVIIYIGLILVAYAIISIIARAWGALAAGDTGYILRLSATLFLGISLYTGTGLILRRFDII